MADTKNQPGRSSSMQRMLDLEKQYMTERHQSRAVQPKLITAEAIPILATTSLASPDRTSILARPVKGYSNRSGGAHRRGTSLPPQLQPLVINNNASHLAGSHPELLMGNRRGISPGNTSNSATASSSEKYTKVIAAELPAREVARCHSPSWEAYERRKMEKKMEKKEREEARKDCFKRLSKKPPPSSSPKALQHALASETNMARGRERERTEKTATVSGSDQERKSGRKARSRSASFVSMLRAPFEFRRSVSTDQVNDPGFIGGIKLELERYTQQQQNLDNNAVEDESNIHPALRKNTQIFHSPLASPGTPSGTDQRRYPPITRGSNYHQKTSSLVVVPTASIFHDASKMDKWRSRVGLKVGPRPQSLTSPGEDLQFRGPADHDHSVECMQTEHLPSASKTPRREKPKSPPTSPMSSKPKPAHIVVAAASSPAPSSSTAPARAGESEKRSENRHARMHSNNESVSSTSSAATGYKTAPSSPPPPEPPQRSSKRHSAGSSADSIPPVPTLTQQQRQQYRHDAHASTTKDAKVTAQRSFPLYANMAKPKSKQSAPEWSDGAASGAASGATSEATSGAASGAASGATSGAASGAISGAISGATSEATSGAASGAASGATSEAISGATSEATSGAASGAISGAASSSAAVGQMSPYLSSHTIPGHGPTSSSEESCDEDFHSASSVSTPATSRPQSERGMPLTCGSQPKSPVPVHDAVRTCFGTTYPLPSAENSEDEGGVDPIQAAAEKVLAVFNGIPVQRRNVCRRRNSHSSVAPDPSFEPSATERPLNLRHRNRSTDPSQSTLSSSPASYLEQVRQQPPAAAPTRAHKQRLGPPTSFVLPADDSNAANSTPKLDKSPRAGADPVRRHLRHKSTPQLASTDQDPVTKIFVECCSCSRYHDMPGNLYKAMSNPEGVLSSADQCGYAGALSMTVRCSWCKHEMSVRCCSALSTKVYIEQRPH